MWWWLLISIALIGVFLWRRRRGGTELLVKDWQRDVVYLIQFPCSREVRSISPFALKLETWLRLNKIRYDNVYTFKFGPKGQIPYIELNGEKIPDSTHIMAKLSQKFQTRSESGLTKKQKATSHAMKIMVEYHTAIAGFYWRYSSHTKQVFSFAFPDMFSNSFLFVADVSMGRNWRKRAKHHGLGRHSDQEIVDFSLRDLDCLSDMLDDQAFFLGTTEATAIDCCIFGNLAQFLFLPLDFPQKFYLRSNCSNLVQFVDRMKEKYWPDWDEMCQPSCMEGKLVK